MVLASGESLGENQTRVSLDGAYRLQYQGDGNLVIYNGDWTGIWSTGTWGHDGARLQIANDEMAVVAPDGTTLWWVSLAAEPAPQSAAGAVAAVVPPAGSDRPRGVPAVPALVAALLTLAAEILEVDQPRVSASRGDTSPDSRSTDSFDSLSCWGRT